MKDEKEQKGRKKHIIIILLWIIALLMLAGLLGYGFYEWKIKPNKRYRSYEIVSQIEREDIVETRYLQYGTKLLKYNRDGVAVLDGVGTILWMAAYHMQNPTVSFSGDYVAVADVGGRQLYVYDAKGSATEVEVLLDVLQISVSKQGEVAILMQGDGLNEIQIVDPYAADNQKKVEIRTYVENDGYGVALALSEDGSKLVTSYFHSVGNKLSSNLTFYSFGGVGQGANADRIVGIFPYEGTLFMKLHFADNNTVCAYGDDRIDVFEMRQKPELLWEELCEQRILRVTDSPDYIMVVTESEDGSAEELRVYERGGNQAAYRKLSFVSTGIGIYEDDFWAYSGGECLILRPGSRIKYEGQFDSSVQYMFAGPESNRFFLVNGQYILDMKLKENAEE